MPGKYLIIGKLMEKELPALDISTLSVTTASAASGGKERRKRELRRHSIITMETVKAYFKYFCNCPRSICLRIVSKVSYTRNTTRNTKRNTKRKVQKKVVQSWFKNYKNISLITANWIGGCLLSICYVAI
ncbi:uncharacterized protein ASCRUDRAFT_137688 [Ascoidea rubescens DSM 1968]|uniref:Uncharacterized protein n=1 Tax=Ascoidea rubescens DSM 1968 TaxID=1344418 RepID=A0A1D2VJE0_9ASCO|nr:hypothetical protein ASCRUDRAFT_137688 [Ascoidea rubescens DSM 1968]ODV61725.1 hypothetical protein ASCRUDRAFT_137688 [Ascoidea rubescens DSM 1968]